MIDPKRNDTSEPCPVEDLVSTIIPVFNRSGLVTKAIQSVLNQTHNNIEILVVNDGSTDDTLEVLNDLARKHANLTIISQKNSGPGAARETGRKQAKGEYIQYLDSDDLLLPEKFAIQIAALKATPEADIAYGIALEKNIESAEVKGVTGRTNEEHKYLYPALMESRWWSTNTPLYRRTLVDQIGPWQSLENEEDWEYETRAAALHARLIYCPEPLSLRTFHNEGHIHQGGTVEPNKLRSRAIAKNLMYSHALRAEQDQDNYYWIFFLKSLFLLARQCGAQGLVVEADQLCANAIQGYQRIGKFPLKIKVYQWMAATLGWPLLAKLLSSIGKH